MHTQKSQLLWNPKQTELCRSHFLLNDIFSSPQRVECPSAVVLLLLFLFLQKPIHHVFLFFLSAWLSLPVTCPKHSPTKPTEAICLKNSVFWKSSSSLILSVPALRFLSRGRRCFLLRDDLQPSLLRIIPGFLHLLSPGSY